MDIRRYLPSHYALVDPSGDFNRFAEVVNHLFTLVVEGGVDLHGDEQTSISVRAMTALRDPTRTPAWLLPYLAQYAGWELDTQAPETLQRKVVGSIAQLLRRKGTKAAIVDGLRLLLGLEVEYRDYFADAWRLGRSLLDETTVLGPARHAPQYARATLTGCSPASVTDGATLLSAAFAGAGYELQRTGGFAGTTAVGYFRGVLPGLLTNNLTLELQFPGQTYQLDLQLDEAYTARQNATTVDLTAAVDEADVAAALAAALAALNVAHNLGLTVTTLGAFGEVRTGVSPSASDIPTLAGSAAAVLGAVGCVGGAAPAGGYQPTNGRIPINLVGATSREEVALRIAYAIAMEESTIDVSVVHQRVLLRRTVRGGADADLAITGTASTLLGATGFRGGIGTSPEVKTFLVSFPRALSADEERAARSVIEQLKRADTRYRLRIPGVEHDHFQLDETRLDHSYLAKGRSGSYEYPVVEADPAYAALGHSWTVALSEAESRRSPRLLIGARYLVTTDAAAYVRQGHRLVEASSADFELRPGVEREVVVTHLRNAFIAARRVSAGAAAFLRITRIDRA